jgi:hypothetical protein
MNEEKRTGKEKQIDIFTQDKGQMEEQGNKTRQGA